MEKVPEFRERALTENEALVAEWLLKHGNEDALSFLPQLQNATVVGECGCGCATVYFAINGKTPDPAGMQILSDYYWIDDSKFTGGIFLYAISGQLAGLEIYSMDGECDASRLPAVHRLIPIPAQDNHGG